MKLSRHFFCNCGTEMIQITKETEFIDYKKPELGSFNEIWFSIYLYGIINHEYSLKERLRHIWQILKHKKPFADFAILSIEEARRMGETLLEMTKDEK